MAEPSDGALNDPEAQPAEADDGFVYRDPDTAPADLVQLAKQGGKGWVYEVDVTDVVRDRPIAIKSVVGAWEVDDEGELTGWFAENDRFDSRGTTEPARGHSLELWPHRLGKVPLDYSDQSLQRRDARDGPWHRFFFKLEMTLIWLEARWMKLAAIGLAVLGLLWLFTAALRPR